MSKEEMLSPIIDEVEDGTISPFNLELKLLLAMQEYSDQNTKPLIDEIYGLSAKIDYLTEENAKLKASKSEANEAVTWDGIFIEYMNDVPDWREEGCQPFPEWLKLNYNTPNRNNK